MYFKQIQEIIDGTKTQTRRVVKPGEAYAFRYLGSTIEHVTDGRAAYNPQAPTSMITKVFTPSGRLKWQVGRDYAVSPGRGKPGVGWEPTSGAWGEQLFTKTLLGTPRPLRIVITAIRCEPLQNISETDAMAEGCPNHNYAPGLEWFDPVKWYAELWDSINTRKGLRWADSPSVWVLEFEVKR